MSLDDETGNRDSGNGNVAPLISGTAIILAMMGAFLWGESHNVDTTPLLAILSPVIGALFIVPRISTLERRTEAVQRSTNGHLTQVTADRDRLQAEVAALREIAASRDAVHPPAAPAGQ